MPRTALTPLAPAAINGAIVATQFDFTFATTDSTNLNSVPSTGREMLLVQNTGGSPATITVTSAPDALGRTADIAAYSVGTALFSLIGPIPTNGWKQSDGNIYLATSANTLKVAVVKIPPGL